MYFVRMKRVCKYQINRYNKEKKKNTFGGKYKTKKYRKLKLLVYNFTCV